jgi:ribonuclease HII
VVAAAVILPKDFFHPLLNDSKKLTAEQRQLLRPIIEKEALAWAVAEVSAAEIDKINILQASILAMHKSLHQLTLQPELLLVDGNRFKPYNFIPFECVVKGDAKFSSIAAASVLAKTYRDEIMTKLSVDFPHYQWNRNAAYPTKAHRAAIAEHGLTPHHRLSFRLLPEEVNAE